MLLRFPNLDSLTLALTSEAVPAAVATAPVEAAFGEGGAIFVFPGAPLKPAAIKSLKALGAEKLTKTAADLQPFLNWLQIVPLARQTGPPEIGDKTPILLEIGESGQLAEVVAEILRLGNDRQSFRHWEADGQSRTLLRVLGPPYYTLLRALDAGAGNLELLAYAEARPRVWVELGYEHPLAARIVPPPGQWLLLRPAREWESLAEGPFQDIYSVLEFALPPLAAAGTESQLAQRLRVPLRLTAMADIDPAELWVLEQDATRQVEQLVAASDNELVARLVFAVVEAHGQPLVVLRVRPSKLPPPVLILNGLACRSYLNLPNLFVPVGQRLHPPLRREAVARLLTADSHQVVWLAPQAGGGFAPRSVPDAAFRPLAQWVDYVLDREHQPLGAWMAAHRFDFAAFVCADDVKPGTPPRKEQTDRPATSTGQPTSQPAGTNPAPADEDVIVAELVEKSVQPSVELKRDIPQPSELARQLSAVEKRFVALGEPLESPARGVLWREMAWLNGSLDRRFDASLCWAHTLWEDGQSSNSDLQTWLDQLADEGPAKFPTTAELQKMLATGSSQRLAVTKLAVLLVGQASRLPNQQPLDPLVARVLAQHENSLPIRLAWLAWVALAKLSNHDALALARARDRLLERLLNQGLTPEHDLPGFLRTGSGGDADRQRILRERLLGLRDLVAEWIAEPPSSTARTRAYADLVFAYGLARLGETAEAQRIVAWARQQLGSRDTLHGWAFQAFEQRIAEAGQGVRAGQLSRELVSIMELMDRVDRYKADRLRQHSRILEPFERIDPYRRWHRHYSDDLARNLAMLFDLTDRDELITRVTSFLANPPAAALTPHGRVRLVTTALELAPRLGEQFAAGLVGRVFPAWDGADDVVDRAWLLEKALLVSAHFDQREAVQAFVERFEIALPDIVRSYLHLQTEHSPERQEKLLTIESLFAQSFRGLRKLGLRDEISRIFGHIVELVRAEAAQSPARPRKGGRPVKDDPTRAAKLLLAVAGGWLFFGQTDQAAPVIDDVRQQLLTAELPPIAKSSLACAYVAATGQAPLDMVLPLVRELFEKKPNGERNLAGVTDTFTTSSHFSLAQLDLVEAAVLTLASDEFVLSQETRRWLEEDEYLVRRRIHRDVREMVQLAGG